MGTRRADNLDTCQTKAQFLEFALDHGGTVKNGGRHPKVVGPNGGICAIAGHKDNEVIPIGTRKSMARQLKAILLVMSLLACGVSYLVMQFFC
jgi:hypothetical protein